MNRDEELQLVEQYYHQAIAGTTTDEEELQVALDLLEKAQRGGVVTDDGSALMYVDQPEIPVDAEYLVEREADSIQQRLRHALPAIGLVVVALVVSLLLYGNWGEKEPAPTPTTVATAVAIHIPTQTLTPTPTLMPGPTDTATPTPTPTATPTLAPPKEVELKPEPVELEAGAVIPVSLEVAGHYLPIVPTTLRDDTWAYVPDPGRASWLAGSTVNVILGLPYTAENLDLLAVTLALSDTLTLRTNVAGTNRYRVVDRRQVGVYEIEVLGQHRAGLTLVLLGGNEESTDRRIVVWAIPTESKE